VYGLTRGGKVRRICDECAHIARMRRLHPEPPVDERAEALKRATRYGTPEHQPLPEPTALPEARPPAELPQHEPYTVRRTPSEVRVGYRTDLPPDGGEDVSHAKF
jgi:hypothetical protein